MQKNAVQPYNGFLNIYKEAGYTSMDVCARLRGILHMRKIGHAGTLDPMAEGVLPVALGRATKDVERIGDGTKTYKASMLLGVVTDTQDITGQMLQDVFGVWKTAGKQAAPEQENSALSETAGLPLEAAAQEKEISEKKAIYPSEEEIRKALLSFVGSYEQLTPMYSARKVNGKKLYEYARAGKEVERKKKTVEILKLTVDEISLPHVRFTVTCTKGTYIRTLCHDAGERLGCGACMESLLRTRVGDFSIENALRLSEVEEARDRGGVDALLSIRTGTAVAIGKFDGSHIGHQKLFCELKKLAQEKRLKTCVLILNNGQKLLESRGRRREEILSFGIDYVIELPFTEELKHMPAEEFLQKILVDKLSMRAMVAGEDVSFGFQKAGNAAFLKALAPKYGYVLKLIPKLHIAVERESLDRMISSMGTGDGAEVALAEENGDLTVSSTLVRRALAAGKMELVTKLLGKPYAISGTVVHGRHLGSTMLGFPTMNLIVDASRALPPFGVYATRTRFLPEEGRKKQASKTGQTACGDPGAAGSIRTQICLEDRCFDGISDLGRKPTVSNAPDYDPERIDLETNLFDCEGDFYGRRICVELLSFIRPERKFGSIEEIREQLLSVDVPEAKRRLGIETPCKSIGNMV